MQSSYLKLKKAFANVALEASMKCVCIFSVNAEKELFLLLSPLATRNDYSNAVIAST